MSSGFAKYGQQKKRQAIRQIQQRSKRLANAQRNPFSWSRSKDKKDNDIPAAEDDYQQKTSKTSVPFSWKREKDVDDGDSNFVKNEEKAQPFQEQTSTTSAPFSWTRGKAADDDDSNFVKDEENSQKSQPSSNPFASNVFPSTSGKPASNENINPFFSKAEDRQTNIPHLFPAPPSEDEASFDEGDDRPNPEEDEPQPSYDEETGVIYNIPRPLYRYHKPYHGKLNQARKAENKRQLVNDFLNYKPPLGFDSSQFHKKRGICMNMCSVQEFNKRREQEIYSVFETIDGTFEYTVAVKEYQRAAADQDESRPVDLRPSIILLKTCQYLFTDLLENNQDCYEEMYDFIWNRTRAIRKDITQQRLCDRHTVLALETIVRFHIFSAYQMANSAQNFAQKYNNENLEKSLTSLRHLYRDLDSKQCPNEAEFRMYYILLNLNSGVVLKDVSSLSQAVLNSQYVKFALSCYNSYNSKNYVRFFRLFKQGPLLACCVLYRYIDNARQKAMSAIINSHTIAVKNPALATGTEYPFNKLINMLGLESVDAAVTFLESMSIDNDGNEAALLKHKQYVVNSNPIKYRMETIDSKITTSYGKIIFTADPIPDSVLGGEVPQSPAVAKPVNYFLTKVPAPQYVLEAVADSYISEAVFKGTMASIKEVYTEQQLRKQSVPVLLEIMTEFCEKEVREILCELKVGVKQQVKNFTEDLYRDLYPSPLLDQVLADVVKETIIEESSLLFVQETHCNLITEVIRQELNMILQTESNYLSRFQHASDKACESLYSELATEVAMTELKVILSEAQLTVKQEKKDDLNYKLQNSVVQKRYYFKLWKKRYSKIYAKKHSLDNIPPRLVPSSSSEVLQTLLGSNFRSSKEKLCISRLAQIDLTSPTKSYQKKVDVKKKLQLRLDLLDEAMALKGIPLKCLSSVSRALYLTLAVDNCSSSMSKFVMDSFGITCAGGEGYVKVSHKVGQCKLKIQLLDLSLTSHEVVRNACKSCHLIVFQTNQHDLLSWIPDVAQDCPKLLISKNKPSSWSYIHLSEPSTMTNIRCCNLYKSLDNAVEETLFYERFLPPFKVVEMTDFTQSLVCVKLTDILLAKQAVLKETKLFTVDPNIIISFYNTLIRNVIEAVRDPILVTVDWPSQFDQRPDVKIDWNDNVKAENLVSELQTLNLPSFRGEPDSAEDCLNYCSSIKTFSKQFLVSTVSSILENMGVQWCLILNQIMHHLIENAIFIESYTVLLDSQIEEISSINGEQIIERAMIFNEIENELSDYQSDSFVLDELEISEIWQSLSKYEDKLSQSASKKPATVDSAFLKTENDRMNSIDDDLRKLSSNISETDSRLQSIVDDGAVPSYLIDSILRSHR